MSVQHFSISVVNKIWRYQGTMPTSTYLSRPIICMNHDWRSIIISISTTPATALPNPGTGKCTGLRQFGIEFHQDLHFLNRPHWAFSNFNRYKFLALNSNLLISSDRSLSTFNCWCTHTSWATSGSGLRQAFTSPSSR
jgi:hypothetical protein